METKTEDRTPSMLCEHPLWMDCGCPTRLEAERSQVVVSALNEVTAKLAVMKAKIAKDELGSQATKKEVDPLGWPLIRTVLLIFFVAVLLFGTAAYFTGTEETEPTIPVYQEEKIRMRDIAPDERAKVAQRMQEEMAKQRREELKAIERRLKELDQERIP